MADANEPNSSGLGLKRLAPESNENDEQHRKRLRQNRPEYQPLRSDGSSVRNPVQASTLENPQECLSAHPVPSSSTASANTAPVVIDLTTDEFDDAVVDTTQSEPPTQDAALDSDRGELPAIESPRQDLLTTMTDVEMTLSASGPETGKESDAPYDTCFGLILMQSSIKTSLATNLEWFPVKVEASGMTLKILTPDLACQIGYASVKDGPTICQVVEANEFTLTATLQVPRNRPNMKYIQATLRIVVYGLMADKQAVAKVLSDGNLFLQHPSLSECDVQVPYFNPQYLLRPGGSMPKLEDLKISGLGRSGGGPLDEDEKSRLLQIFESANDPNATFGIRPSLRLQSTLEMHQISALAMMVEKECQSYDQAVFPSIWEPIKDNDQLKGYRHAVTGQHRDRHPALLRGGILADEMGLGKTLSAIALILWHLDYLESSKAETQSRLPTLIITPKSTIPEWNQQFQKHVKPGRIKVQTYHGDNRRQIATILHEEDVILATYDTLRSENEYNGPLLRTEWARVILDEAHTIRNRDSKVFKAAKAINASCRWCLTGTPIQNHLDDFGALLSFIRVPSLNTHSDFNICIAQPVKERKNYAFKRLRQVVRATCLRRNKANAGSSLELPEKKQVFNVLELHSRDRELYNFFKRRAAIAARSMQKSGDNKRPKSKDPGAWTWRENILPLVSHLRRICDHGEHLLPAAALKAWRDKDIDSIDWQLMKLASQKCSSCDIGMEESNDLAAPVELACGHTICTTCYDIKETERLESSRASCSKCSVKSPLPEPSQDNDLQKYKPSVKIKALLQNLRSEHSVSEGQKAPKSVVFSCWTDMLNFIEKALRMNDICFQRIDGRTTLRGREKALKAFHDDPDCKVMLASIQSLGEGVNLSVASNVHIMEPDWNPMREAQAVDRVHRIGQQRDVLITRYLIKDSIEFYVRGVQEEKLRLIHQSLSVTEVNQSDIPGQRLKKLLEVLS